jgi:hypothetical protein
MNTKRTSRSYLHDAFYLDPSHKRPTPLQHDNGLWFFRNRLCIPDSKPLRQQLLRESHDNPYAGHQGKHTTLEILFRNIWWSRLAADMTSYVRTCHSCQVNKPTSLTPAGLLQPLSIPNRCSDSVSMEFMTALPKTARGHDAIAVFMDRLSKCVHIIPTKMTITAIQFAATFREFALNNHHSSSTSFTPFSMVYGQHPRQHGNRSGTAIAARQPPPPRLEHDEGRTVFFVALVLLLDVQLL